MPTSSISCPLTASLGANEILVRRFLGFGGNAQELLDYLKGSVRAKEGDCSSSPTAYDRWVIGGSDVGTVLCYIDGPSGDAILYWSYDDHSAVVKATNQRGDSAALYAFFEKYAKFISP
jgi:hypothetical protein